MAEHVECTLRLRTGAKPLTVYPLNGVGGRMPALHAKDVARQGASFRIHLASDTPWYEIAAR